MASYKTFFAEYNGQVVTRTEASSANPIVRKGDGLVPHFLTPLYEALKPEVVNIIGNVKQFFNAETLKTIEVKMNELDLFSSDKAKYEKVLCEVVDILASSSDINCYKLCEKYNTTYNGPKHAVDLGRCVNLLSETARLSEDESIIAQLARNLELDFVELRNWFDTLTEVLISTYPLDPNALRESNISPAKVFKQLNSVGYTSSNEHSHPNHLPKYMPDVAMKMRLNQSVEPTESYKSLSQTMKGIKPFTKYFWT